MDEMTGMPQRLMMAASAWRALLAHMQAGLPEEACGMLGGAAADATTPGAAEVVAQVFLPVENELHSPVRFRMDARGMLAAFNELDARGLGLVGLAHSHPAGPRQPSPTDLAEFAYPGVLSLICTPDPELPASGDSPGWQVRAFWIESALKESVLNARAAFVEVPLVRLP